MRCLLRLALYLVFFLGSFTAVQAATCEHRYFNPDAGCCAKPVQVCCPPLDKACSTIRMNCFSAIKIDGDFDVVIMDRQNEQKVVIEGDQEALENTLIRSHGGVFYLSTKPFCSKCPPRRHRTVVRIYLCQPLKFLDVAGNTCVRGQVYCPGGLSINAHGNCSVNLRGVLNLQRVTLYTHGEVIMSGVSTQYLTVCGGGTGRLCLGGRIGTLKARLSGRFHLEAGCVRVCEAYVQTQDVAIASVYPVFALYAFATGYSHILYYNTPKKLVRYTQESGNVLYGHYYRDCCCP